ncbi:MAG: hypothetical protein AAFR88_06700 [Pseudomonadota bacterium]
MRALIVLLAYACAALSAALVSLAFTVISLGGESMTFGHYIFGVLFFASLAAIYALPVAIPTIAYSEFKKVRSWKVFVSAGFILGAVLVIFFAGAITNFTFGFAAMLMLCSICGAMAYWLVAWRWLGPKADTGAL